MRYETVFVEKEERHLLVGGGVEVVKTRVPRLVPVYEEQNAVRPIKAIPDFRGYQLHGNAGPKVVGIYRAEHLCDDGNHHVHVKQKDSKDLRINCETLEELDGRPVPRDLRRHLEENKGLIRERVKNIFESGTI
jgi:hypothetical protein